MDGVRAAVGAFYKRVLADPQLAPFFEGVDMAKQQAKQVFFLDDYTLLYVTDA